MRNHGSIELNPNKKHFWLSKEQLLCLTVENIAYSLLCSEVLSKFYRIFLRHSLQYVVLDVKETRHLFYIMVETNNGHKTH